MCAGFLLLSTKAQGLIDDPGFDYYVTEGWMEGAESTECVTRGTWATFYHETSTGLIFHVEKMPGGDTEDVVCPVGVESCVVADTNPGQPSFNGAAGCPSCSGGTQPGSPQGNPGQQISFGSSSSGFALGELRYSPNALGSGLLSLADVQPHYQDVQMANEVTVLQVLNQGGQATIRQYVTPEIVITIDATGGSLNTTVYRRDDSVEAIETLPPNTLLSFQAGAVPITEMLTTRDDAEDKVQVTGTYNGRPFSSEYKQAQQAGGGIITEKLESGKKHVTTTTYVADVSDFDGQLIVEMVEDFYWRSAHYGAGGVLVEGSYQLEKQIIRTFRTLPDGRERLISEDVARASFNPTTLEPVSQPGLTTYTYEESLYVQGVTVSKSFGKLLSQTNPDGSWVRYEYDMDGNLVRTYKPWLSAPAAAASATPTNCLCEETVYTTPADPYAGGIRTTRILGIQVAQETVVRTRDLVTQQDTETRSTWHPAGWTLGSTQPITTQEVNVYYRDEYDNFRLVSHQDSAGVKSIHHQVSHAAINDLGLGADATLIAGLISYTEGLTARYEVSPLTATGQTVVGRTKKTATITDEAGQLLGSFVWVATSAGTAGFSGSSVSYQLVDGEYYNHQVSTQGIYTSTTAYALDGQITRLTDYYVNEVSGPFEDYAWGESTLAPIEGFKTTAYRVDGSLWSIESSGRGQTQSFFHEPFFLNGNPVPLARMTTATGRLITKEARDNSGQVIWSQDGLGRATYYLRSGTSLTEVRPGDVRVTTQRHLDGSLAAVSGNGALPENHTYEVNANGTITETVQRGAIGAGQFWTKTIRDYAGNVLSTQQPKPPTGPGDPADVASAPVETVTYYRDSIWRTVRVDSPAMRSLTVYDELGEVRKQGIDVDQNGTLDQVSSDAYVDYGLGVPARGIQSITENGGTAWWSVESQVSYTTAAGAGPVYSSQRRKLGVAIPPTVAIAPDGTRTDEETMLDNPLQPNDNYAVISTVKRPGATAGEVTGRGYVFGEISDVNLPGVNGAINYYYFDQSSQVSQISDPRQTERFFFYNAVTGQLERMEEFGDANADDNRDRVTHYAYYPATHANAGKLKEVTYPDGKKEVYAYDSLGRLIDVCPYNAGADMASYPVRYTFNAHGQKETMTTWIAAATPQVTTWEYHFGGGPLARKRIQKGNGEDVTAYYYRNSQQVGSRIDPRSITTTYGYDNAGRVTSRSYSDSTPAVTITYDRHGREISVVDASGTRTITHGPPGQAWSLIDYTSGLMTGTKLTHTFDSKGRPLTLGVSRKKTATTWDPRILATYGYLGDSAQLASIQFGSHTARYSGLNTEGDAQLDIFDHVGQLPREIKYTVLQGATTRTTLIGTRSTDPGLQPNDGQLVTKSLSWARGTTSTVNTAVVAHEYRYDERGRRHEDIQLDGTVWAHEYNSRGEVIGSARRDTLGGNAGPGRDFGYFYDDIGNRITSLENQFDNGNPNVPATLSDITTYGSNLANQFTQKLNPDPAKSWVLGRTSTGTGTLLVKHTKTGTTTPVVTAPLDRYGVGDKDFAAEIAFGVTTAPAYRNIKVTVGTTTTTWGDLYLPPKNEVPTYDAAGNLTGDGRWTYTWDAENRLTSMETKATAVTAGITKQRLEFTYDSLNRRVRKVLKGWVSNAWVVQGDLRFLYDGWNLVAELEPVTVTSATSLPAYVRTYTWGKDVTGTEQGAGGVGGLLFVGRYTKDTGTNVLASTLAPMYDGNSNIEGYVKLLVPTASTSAASVEAFKLEYDPFGRELMIAATSPETQATLPPFRFSTQYTDSETDLVYYINRYYSPELGRWISGDPIEEAGGLNLYGMVGNDPVNRWDYLGKSTTYDFNGNPNTVLPYDPRPENPAMNSGIGDVVILFAAFSIFDDIAAAAGGAFEGLSACMLGMRGINVVIKSHGLRHIATSLQSAVIGAIKADLKGINLAVGQNLQRQITVNGQTFTYRAFKVTEKEISVGTVFQGAATRNIAK